MPVGAIGSLLAIMLLLPATWSSGAAADSQPMPAVGEGVTLGELGLNGPVVLDTRDGPRSLDIADLDIPSGGTATDAARALGFRFVGRVTQLDVPTSPEGADRAEVVLSVSVNDRTAIQIRIVDLADGWRWLANGWIDGPRSELLELGGEIRYANYLMFESSLPERDELRIDLDAPEGVSVAVEIDPRSGFVGDVAPSAIAVLSLDHVGVEEVDGVRSAIIEYCVESDRARQLSLDLTDRSGLAEGPIDVQPLPSPTGGRTEASTFVAGVARGVIRVPIQDGARSFSGVVVASTEFNEPSMSFEVRNRPSRFGGRLTFVALAVFVVVYFVLYSVAARRRPADPR